MYKVDNAIIMAAGTASRFAPLSHERPKALITVKGEVLIERQIRQLKQAGINDIYIVVGYMAEKFRYLESKLGVTLIENPDYNTRNNNASINAVKHLLGNTYICSADNYFAKNPFEKEVGESYYAAVYADGETKEWCISYDEDNTITDVVIGGENAWYMLGHTFWSEEYSRRFVKIFEAEYDLPETAGLLWESIYIKHIDELFMKIRKYADGIIFEFDTLDELREFDASYISDTRSEIIEQIADELGCTQADIVGVVAYRDDTNEAAGFTFAIKGDAYRYSYREKSIRRL